MQKISFFIIENIKKHRKCPALNFSLTALLFSPPMQFKKVNGFSNQFWGWGGEDDDMSNRIRNKKLKAGWSDFSDSRKPFAKMFIFEDTITIFWHEKIPKTPD